MAEDHNPLDPYAQMTRAQRLEYRFFLDQMKQFEWHLRWSIWDQRIVPDIWHRALEAEGQPPKTRVTIRLDEDLVKFFRKMGPGWQTTLNAVVRSFVKARLSGIIEGPLSLDKTLPGLGDYPEIGDAERGLERMRAALRRDDLDPVGTRVRDAMRARDAAKKT
ncbi:MAG: BrnA antitoxin family protein [Pseudomonadota bacterium]